MSVTAAGIAVVDGPTAWGRALLAEILGRLTPEQQSAVVGALRAFTAAARDVAGQAGEDC